MNHLQPPFQSYWEREHLRIESDVIIIGTGLVGCQCAIRLKQLNPDLTISMMDRRIVPIGASTRNAGFACFGSATEILADLKNDGEEAVVNLIKRRWDGLKLLIKTIGEKNLRFERNGGYEIFDPTQKEDSYEKALESLPQLNDLIQDVTGINDVFSVRSSDTLDMRIHPQVIYNRAEGQLDPGLMMYSLLKQVRALGIQLISQEVNEIDMKAHCCHTALGEQVYFKNCVVTTNAFSQKLIPDLDLEPARNQVMITEPIPSLAWKGTFHMDEGYVYFRNVENRLLIGGARNIDSSENRPEFGLTDTIQSHLRDIVNNVILPGKEWREDCWWSGIIATGTSKEPILTQLQDHLYVGARLGGMGVAIGSLVGFELAELILS